MEKYYLTIYKTTKDGAETAEIASYPDYKTALIFLHSNMNTILRADVKSVMCTITTGRSDRPIKAERYEEQEEVTA